ncbi:hypothetical protein [Nocardia mangyaensis]|uniref:hypothetical protein n=1 Tax=Nocardia mangyaensis TaxID=2213200 RepID=UPI0026754EB5|nr:hypothetical protein [Nocardia mangyaensis]MDO3649904.1 hypothetical protein [Nocardia mangyaensis]
MRITHVSALAAVFLTLGTASAAAEPNPADTPRQAIARAYLDALVSHDASAVPFAPDATRVEVGFQTGYSGPQLTADLEHGLQYRVIQGYRELTMTESGDTVTTRYLLDTGIAGVRLTTVEIVETFVIPDDEIQTIEATITPVL